MTPLIAVAAAAAAAAIWCAPRPALRDRAGGFAPSTASVVGVAALIGLVAMAGRWWVPVVLAAVFGAAGLWLWRTEQRHRHAVETGRRVLEVCEQLAAELGAGLPTGLALERAVRVWPPLAAAAEAQRMGADVPAALRTLADATSGAGQLRLLAAAWQVAHRTGQGLAAGVDRVAAELRADQVTRRVVQGELASARATARLMAVLPVLALAMGSGVGGDPWTFLLRHPLGWACLAGGGLCALAGLWWIESLARAVGAPR